MPGDVMVWLIVVLIGVGVHGVGIIDSATRWVSIRRRQLDEGRAIVAMMRLRHEVVRFFVQIAFTIAALLVVSDNPRWTAKLLTSGAIALLVNSLLDRRAEQQLLGIGMSQRLRPPIADASTRISSEDEKEREEHRRA